MKHSAKWIPAFDDIFAVMSAAFAGNTTARVTIPEQAMPDRAETKLALALNYLLDDWALSSAERQRTEEALRDSNQKLLALFDKIPFAAVLSKPPAGVIVFVNEAFEHSFGYTRQEAVGKTTLELGINPDVAGRARILAELRAQGSAHDIELVLNTKSGHARAFIVNIEMVEISGDKYILQMVQDITELKHAQAELQRLASTDGLTNLFNRRHFLELADTEVKRSIRFKHPLSLVFLDLDHFKRINDTFGHPAGDQALITFAQVCQENIREIDLLARFGGEEFALLMPETDLEQAERVAERLRQTIAQLTVQFETHQISFTCSFGITALMGEQDTLDLILQRADQALYAAKQAGRNRVVRWQASLAPLPS